MIRENNIEFLFENYTKALKELWEKEKKFIFSTIRKKGKKITYFKKPLENMFKVFSTKEKLIKRIKEDISIKTLSKIKKENSFILTPGNIPLIEIEYIYFLLPLSKKILWRPSKNFIELSLKLKEYLEKHGINFIEISREDLEEITKRTENSKYFVLIGTNRTIQEFKKNIDKSAKILEYGSKTSAAIVDSIKNIKDLIKDITYFSHSGCLSPTIIYIKEKIYKKFLKEFERELKKEKGVFTKKEKLFNYYLFLSENENFKRVGEFYIAENPENILISRGFINTFSFKNREEVIRKLNKIKKLLQGISVCSEEYKENLKNFKGIYIKKTGKLQLIDEKFFPDGIKPLSTLIKNN